MKKYKKGYKVVTRRTLMSCNMLTLFGSVKYKVDKWVKPVKGFGPLCVFNTIEDAEYFNHYMLDSIYECFYEESKKDVIYYISNLGNIVKRGLESLPTGTVLATRVKLIRRVR